MDIRLEAHGPPGLAFLTGVVEALYLRDFSSSVVTLLYAAETCQPEVDNKAILRFCYTSFECIAHFQRVEAPHRNVLLLWRSMGGPIPIVFVITRPSGMRDGYEPLTTSVLLVLGASALTRRVLSRLLITMTGLVLRRSVLWRRIRLSTGSAPAT